MSAQTLQWMFQSDIPGFPGRGIETTPLVIDGVMYVTSNGNRAWALDARTGSVIWMYERKLPENVAASIFCGPVNRGFAIHGERLFMGTLDGRLVSLERKTGTRVWEAVVGDLKSANPITMAPLVVKDKVIVGVAGSDFATRGYLDAYDTQTGVRAWRFYTIPMKGEPGGHTWPSDDVARRGRTLDHGHVRSRTEPRVLWRRQSQPEVLRARSPW
jgi:alcohol dehydrogenase (cytochrome c)